MSKFNLGNYLLLDNKKLLILTDLSTLFWITKIPLGVGT